MPADRQDRDNQTPTCATNVEVSAASAGSVPTPGGRRLIPYIDVSYPGPPPTTPPPPGWRPPVVVRPAPPRQLPSQDHDALDADERAARRVTWAVAAVAGMIALVVACVLGGSLLD